MTKQHDQARTHDATHTPTDHSAAPGRTSRTAHLLGPIARRASGLAARQAERDDNGVAAGADAAIAEAASSWGSALPATVMRTFEASLGADLSGVRVHTGAASVTAAHAVGAKAYTIGQDIHFGAGHYDPASASGRHLLAHEVAHTVQQRGGAPTRMNQLEVSSPQDAAELEADRAADAMVSGTPTQVQRSSGVAREQLMREPGTLVMPTIEIVAAADPAAYNAGYQDGVQFGGPQDANLRPYLNNQASLNSYAQGNRDGCSANPQTVDSPTVTPGVPSGPDHTAHGHGEHEPDEPEELDPQAYGRYLFLKNQIRETLIRIALGMTKESAMKVTSLTDADIEEYRQLFEEYGLEDPDPERVPDEIELEEEEEAPEGE